MQESVYFAVYKAPENRLLVFADDGQPRWITCSTMVDYTTVAAGDRFGNIFVNRLDIKVSDQVDDDPTGAGILHEKGLFMGAPHKTQLLAHVHIGDLITSIHKVSMVAGGREVLLYTCLHGMVGARATRVEGGRRLYLDARAAYSHGADEPRWQGPPCMAGLLRAREGGS